MGEGPAAHSFGRWLRKSRELRGLTFDEVVASTRLPARVVAALEADEAAAMPDRTYALQYVRAVALAVGLDAEEVALRYEEWLQTLPQATLPPPPIERGRVGRALGLLRRAAGLPLRISRDPLLWAAALLTLLVCLGLLLRRR
jgi:hypothetical protein